MNYPPLFTAYPQLKDRVPWVPLGDLPTPVLRADRLAREVGLNHLYVKRDDLTSTRYGGNKVRKLEFLLADAQRKRADVLITVGGVGSNHALATTIHGRRLGMRSILLLTDQPLARYVRTNMLLDHAHQAKMVKTSLRAMPWRIAWHYLSNARLSPLRFPYCIPAGGSSPLGCLGYVNAAFELKQQVEQGLLPEPDCVFVASGSVGTGSGLQLGCRLAGLKTQVINVRIYKATTCNARRIAFLMNRTCALLRRSGADVPGVRVSPHHVTILHDYVGEGYALFTEEGMRAVSMMKDLEGIALDGTYTGKSLAGALDYTRRRQWQDRVILFWDTYNSADLSAQAAGVDYHDLPRPFHPYFETPVQRLDTDTPPERQR